MRRPLNEQIVRMYSLIYGREKIEKKLNIIKEAEKADVVTADVQKFYSNLKNISTPLSQQSRGQMNFQKDVETLQIALILLGYELPRFGVDGLFGPETAAAVEKFKQDHLTNLQESASNLRAKLNKLGYDEKGNEISSGGQISDDISKIVSEILEEFKKTHPDINVVVTAGNDRYHHGLDYVSKHTQGNAIDLVLQPYNKKNASLFINILEKYKSTYPEFSYIDEYSRPTKRATGGHFHLQYGKGGGGGRTKPAFVTVTDDVVNKIYELISQERINSNDIKPFVNSYTNTGDSNLFTELDLETVEGYKAYLDICQTFINQRTKNIPDIKITGEMMARAARDTYLRYGKYVPPELALSQMAVEGGLNPDPNVIPRRTNNPYNIGNTGKATKTFDNVKEGIDEYYKVMATKYLNANKPSSLIQNFVNFKNVRYATSTDYEAMLNKIIPQIKRISDNVVAKY